ncbi:Uncharacterized protein PHSC3_001405 [Chlamydiales bacterium STE3]|nr:Uncharacterized protein PHSC3_001405 [Chlamydiales bacterium STE3]
MTATEYFSHLLTRFRYPVSLPEDIAQALGVNLSNAQPFKEFVKQLIAPTLKPTTLTKFMIRDQAEQVFCNALRKERFHQSTLFSYYFSEGWLEFVLKFDDKGFLRRVYMMHRDIPERDGREIPLT